MICSFFALANTLNDSANLRVEDFNALTRAADRCRSLDTASRFWRNTSILGSVRLAARTGVAGNTTLSATTRMVTCITTGLRRFSARSPESTAARYYGLCPRTSDRVSDYGRVAGTVRAMKHRIAIAISVVALFTAAGCSSGSGAATSVPAVVAPETTLTVNASSDHNDADVTFAQSMIPHHTQAVEMAQLVMDKGSSAEVKALGERIKAAQSPEIEQMRGWLTAWGAPETMAGMDMGGQGMMSKTEMASFSALSGAALDRKFLETMTAHHEGAITMANVEQTTGKDTAAIALANSIVTSQEAEIKEMKALLAKQ